MSARTKLKNKIVINLIHSHSPLMGRLISVGFFLAALNSGEIMEIVASAAINESIEVIENRNNITNLLKSILHSGASGRTLQFQLTLISCTFRDLE